MVHQFMVQPTSLQELSISEDLPCAIPFPRIIPQHGSESRSTSKLFARTAVAEAKNDDVFPSSKKFQFDSIVPQMVPAGCRKCLCQQVHDASYSMLRTSQVLKCFLSRI